MKLKLESIPLNSQIIISNGVFLKDYQQFVVSLPQSGLTQKADINHGQMHILKNHLHMQVGL